MTSESAKSVDGCATFWRRNMFSLAAQEAIEYQSLGLRKHDTIGQSGMNRLLTKDNVALALVLKPTPTSGLPMHNFILVNTHIHWDPAFCDVKLVQVALMLEQLELLSQNYRNPAMIIAGDFNSMTDSGVYQLLATRQVDGAHRDFNSFDYGKYTSGGIKHALELKSAYHAVLGVEPSFTNYTGDFVGTLDYIWATKSMQPVRVLTPVPEEIVLSLCGALPNPFMCSDHIPLVADFFVVQ